MTAILTKWDASVVGDSPYVGEWRHRDTGEVIKPEKQEPHKFARFFNKWFRNRVWHAGLKDPSRYAGCLEVVAIPDDRPHEIIYRRN